MRFLRPLAALALVIAAPSLAAPAPVADLVARVDIPYQQFTLPNGLRVVVNTDRKAPIVAVSVWYKIGSKDEPAGKTGFAHLFEHLMFNGSENNRQDFFVPLEDVGATDYNGTTWFDRTNYFENVPTPALPLALYLESDRMGHLLGAIDQKILDNQRSVVQNEKRQNDNRPYGLSQYAVLEGLFPDSHPYHHTTIGSMADLDGASLDDVKGWFRANYGPQNAVLVLSGDVDVPTARALTAKYFGDIPRGPDVRHATAPLPVRTKTTETVLHDAVAQTRLTRIWLAPGRTDPAIVQLDIAATILADGASSRLYNDLVRDKQLAVGVDASTQPFELASQVSIDVSVKPGVDPAKVQAEIDRVVADFLKDGPTEDEVERVATLSAAQTIRGLEAVGGFGGKAATLAEGLLYAGDPGFYKVELKRYADATPESVRDAARRWLGQGDFRLTVLPGTREAEAKARARESLAETPKAAKPTAPPAAAAPAGAPRPPRPEVTGYPALHFPAVQRATLSNGLVVELAERHEVPVVRMSLSFDAGNAADSRAKPGLQTLMLALAEEGTKARTARQIAEEQERLGAGIGESASMDRTRFSLNALKPNLAESLDLFADVVRNPLFAPAELERVRGQMLARIAEEFTEPNALALRVLPELIYGPGHPYAVPFTGTGTPAGVRAVTQADLFALHRQWIRPDNARLFVVGDTNMAELMPLLEGRLGNWAPPPGAKGVKTFVAARPTGAGRIILIDRPGSPQSLILAGTPLAVKGLDNRLPLFIANDILGGNFTSRLNTDLRETRGWAYGVSTSLGGVTQQIPLFFSAPVQTDKTGPSIAAAIADFAAYRGKAPPTSDELKRAVENDIRSLPGGFESAGSVLGSIERNYLFGRPDDWQATLPARYSAITLPEVKAVAEEQLDASKLVWVVVGDRAQVEPQLKAVGLPVEVRAAQ